MSSPPEAGQGPGGERPAYRDEGIRTLLEMFASGDPAERTKMFQDAEKLLVTEAPGVFIYHRYQSDIYKPYLKGTELEPDQNGVAAIHWPGYSNYDTVVGSMYISKDVANANRQLP